MPDTSAQVEIPNRALFKAAEVCELVKVQPYVLRSWESEFPELGVTKNAGGPRVYRRVDVEQVARIRHLLLVDGLTLAGARRKLQDESSPIAADAPAIEELIGRNARDRLTIVKRGLRSILELLAAPNGGQESRFATPRVAASSRVRPMPASRAKPSRGKAVSSRGGSSRSSSHRKRSA